MDGEKLIRDVVVNVISKLEIGISQDSYISKKINDLKSEND